MQASDGMSSRAGIGDSERTDAAAGGGRVLARRRNEVSASGARFDMETDTVLTVVLAVLVFSLDKSGAWILAAGMLRYLFVLGSFVWHWLERPLALDVVWLARTRG